MSVIFTGCSSYYNRQWQGIFYPEGMPTKEWFAYYCTHFNTYELNASFYHFPTTRSLQTWYRKSPPEFIFSIKASKIITHTKKFVGCEAELAEFYKACEAGLKDKLACVLFQLPPSFHYTPERLALIIASLNPEFCNAIEFRHASWWTEEVHLAFRQHKLSFCNVNYPKLPPDIIATTPTAYVRLHGNPRLFYSEYHALELQVMLDQLAKLKLKNAFIYFNNTASTAGILNALAVQRSYRRDAPYKHNHAGEAI